MLTEGEWAGRPFVLEPWQENDIVRPLFGWKRADGTRRYRRAYVWVPRKNGKTELAAGLALLMLLGDGEPGGQVFSIASEKAQASIVFNKATVMVERSPNPLRSHSAEPAKPAASAISTVKNQRMVPGLVAVTRSFKLGAPEAPRPAPESSRASPSEARVPRIRR